MSESSRGFVAFAAFLSAADAARIDRSLERLSLAGLRGFALTGSVAVEAQLAGRDSGRAAVLLNDLDIVVDSFESLPGALADDFLARHIHPEAPEGRMLLQLVDPREKLRIDVFRPYGSTMARCRPLEAGEESIREPMLWVSLEDLAARAASLVLNLERGEAVAAKHARALRRLLPAVDADRMESVWQEHRKPSDPRTFSEATARIHGLVEERADLLVVPDYSRDVRAVCAKCSEVPPLRLAPAETILSMLGYC